MAADIPLVLYPTAQRLAEGVDRLVDREKDTALLIPGMMTIQAFERALSSSLLGPSTTAGGFTKSIVLSNALTRLYGPGGGGGAFSGAARFPGFLGAMLELFDQLGAGLVSPADLAKIGGYSPAKEGDILLLYRAYEEDLARLGAENGGMARRRLVEALDRAGRIPFLDRFSRVQLEDIYQFTPFRFELIRRIARLKPVRIVAPAPDGRRMAFGFLADNLAKFEELGDGAGDLEIAFEEEREGPLKPARQWIFQMDPTREPDEPRPPVRIIRCPGRYREVEEVGREIWRLRREKGYRWRDIIVAVREARPYASIVEDVFRRYRIPFFMKKGIPLSRTPLARAALSLFVAVESAFARDDVLRLVTTPYFGRFAGLDPVLARRLFNESGMINGSAQEWKQALARAAGRMEKKDAPAARSAASAASALLARLEPLMGEGRPAEFVKLYTGLLKWLKLAPPEGAKGPMAREAQFRDNHSAAMFRAVLAEAEGELERIGSVAGGSAGYQRLRGILVNAVDGLSMPEPGVVDQNRVQVLNVFDLVGVKAGAVFVMGLHEGEFPQRGRAGAILTAAERAKFNELHFHSALGGRRELGKGRRVFDAPAEKWMEESLLFFQAMRSAREELFLTCCVQDLDGTPLMRSLFVDDMLDALSPGRDPAARERLVETAPGLAIARPADQLLDPEEARMKLLKDIFSSSVSQEDVMDRAAAVAPDGGSWRWFARLVSLAAMERGRDAYFSAAGAEAKARLGGPYSGDLTAGAGSVRGLIADVRGGRYSPTALENYGKCPFRFFASRILGLEPEREPEMQLLASDVGTAIHQVLEEFYLAMMAEKRLPVKNTPPERDLLLRLAEQVFAGMRKDGLLPEEPVWAPERERIMAMLERWLPAEAADQAVSGFLPIGVEMEFDFPRLAKAPFPPFAIRLPDGGERYLTGVMDRLDLSVSGGAIRIVDYKLASGGEKYRKMLKRENMGKLSFQPPIYALLAQQWILAKGILKTPPQVAAAYRLLAAPDPDKAYVSAGYGAGKNHGEFVDRVFLGSGEGAEGREGTFENLTARMIGRLEGGSFPVEPEDCEYCDFAGMCRYIAAPRTGEEE